MENLDKIKLKKNAGPIVFLGQSNSMPMMYAIELKKKGYEVLYFVDCPASEKLSRPENHYSDIGYPYPSWIIEIELKTQMLIPFFKMIFALYIKYKIKKITNKEPQVYFLNGFFVTLAPLLKNGHNSIIALSHGSDLDSWADMSSSNDLNKTFVKYSFFKFLPSIVSKRLIKYVIFKQFSGLILSNKVVYFPKGFNENGDRVISKLMDNNVSCHERYDISFEPLKYQSRNYKICTGKLVIFSGVRFMYKNFSEGNTGYSKGNDIIIKGLALYYKYNKNIEIHFVEKGPDVDIAKKLCLDNGLDDVVIWHKEMKFLELLDLYDQSDICFDQVGQHWVGAIGCYALWLGKPLIANIKLPVQTGIWPIDNPVFNASNEKEVFDSLLQLSNDKARVVASDKSKGFAEKYLGPQRLLNEVFEF